MGREIKGTVSRGGSSSVQCQWREVKSSVMFQGRGSQVHSVSGREIECTVSKEGKLSVQCQVKISQVYSIKGREVKCTVSREGN